MRQRLRIWPALSIPMALLNFAPIDVEGVLGFEIGDRFNCAASRLFQRNPNFAPAICAHFSCTFSLRPAI